MKRTLACLVALTLVLGLAIAASGCTTGSTTGSPSAPASTPSSETSAAEPSVEATAFDAQAFVDTLGAMSSDEMQAAVEALTTEQQKAVAVILSANAKADTPAAPKVYKHLTSRAFKLLVKDPDSYIGKTYYIYGQITQFDAATGTEMFRADVGPKKLAKSYGYVFYPQNAFLSGTDSQLKKYVQDDLFTAKVTVLGSYSYDTQAGGNTTVPQFQIDSISRTGSAK